MPKQGRNYFSFLLRAWKDHEVAEWRFSLQETSGEKRLNFGSFQSLVTFLSNLFEGGKSEKTNPSQPSQKDDSQSNSIES